MSHHLFTSFALCIFVLAACTNSKHTNSNEETKPDLLFNDSIKKVEIDTIVSRINQQIVESPIPIRFAFPILSPGDSIDYWLVDGKPKRISAMMTPGDILSWPTFFSESDSLVLVRLRIADKNPEKPWARESMVYLDNQIIIYCEERGKDLEAGEVPGSIRMLPFAKCLRTQEEIQSEYIHIWPKIKEAVEQHMKGTSDQ